MVRPRYAGLQPGVTKRTGTAACKKALVMLRHCYARLQLEVAKCIVTAAGMIVFKLRLSRYAVHKRTAMATPREEFGHRSYRQGSPVAVDHRRSSPDRRQFREIAERRGQRISAKRCLGEEVA